MNDKVFGKKSLKGKIEIALLTPCRRFSKKIFINYKNGKRKYNAFIRSQKNHTYDI